MHERERVSVQDGPVPGADGVHEVPRRGIETGQRDPLHVVAALESLFDHGGDPVIDPLREHPESGQCPRLDHRAGVDRLEARDDIRGLGRGSFAATSDAADVSQLPLDLCVGASSRVPEQDLCWIGATSER